MITFQTRHKMANENPDESNRITNEKKEFPYERKIKRSYFLNLKKENPKIMLLKIMQDLE